MSNNLSSYGAQIDSVRDLSVSNSNFFYIQPESLAQMVRDGLQNHDVVIVDVRDDDFFGGNIKGAINLPSLAFTNDANIDKLIEKTSNAKHVVFHCAKSLQRGPSCAREFSRKLKDNSIINPPSVLVFLF
jgi:rhodanese-related sulfurtransferase